MSHMDEVLRRAQQVMIGNYARLPVAMVRGEGAYLWDADGKQYLDLFAGFGGAILGHCHPALIAAATEQAAKLWHVGNVFHTEPQVEFAERLNRHAFQGQAFFCHSGAEANEAACKLARLRGNAMSPQRWKIISLHKSFHGRTLAMISATGNPAIRAGFSPDVPGFTQVEGGNFEALLAAVDDQTAGIILEPIQGEGGINVHPDSYFHKIRQLCDERQITLIFDEVWTGCGRTGKYFGHQHLRTSDGKPIEPDIMTLGKAAGGGLPVGAMYAKPHIAALLTPGKHGCTLGGNLICMAVARTVFDIIERERITDHAAAMGELAIARLRNEPRIKDKIAEVRGRGLFLGIQLNSPPEKLLQKAMANGLIINLTAKTVIRLAPPINIAEDQWRRGLDLLVQTLAEL